MLIVLHPDVSASAQAAIESRVRELGFTPHAIEGAGRTAIGITGNKGPIDPGHFRELPGVADCIPVTAPYKLVSREVKHEDTVVDVAGVPVGGPELVVMAGPCAVESEEQILTAARGVAASGASLLRGGAFKPRTSPYDFQGLKQKGLELLTKARAETGLKIVTEVKDTETLGAVVESADLLQIGARNMQNFSLLEAVGDVRKPVLLKRGMSSTIKELLMAAEFIVSPGDKSISHRALIFAALAEGESRMAGLAPGGDVRSTARCLAQLGVPVLRGDGTPWAEKAPPQRPPRSPALPERDPDMQADDAIVRGHGLSGLREPSERLDCGNSGTTIRLLTGVIAGAGIEATLTGDESLSRRPMERVAKPLRQLGAEIETTHGKPPG